MSELGVSDGAAVGVVGFFEGGDVVFDGGEAAGEPVHFASDFLNEGFCYEA